RAGRRRRRGKTMGFNPETSGTWADAQAWLQQQRHSSRLLAHEAFMGQYHRATFARFVRRLLGRHEGLLDLNVVIEHSALISANDLGLQTVPLTRIVGSEGRSADFDCQFRPLCDHNGQRWARIYEACLIGNRLPPVDLIEIRGAYFVRDGHHRISVACALGKAAIEALVKHWELAPQVLPADEAVQWRVQLP
ncbi:MAG: hypothetical protein JXA74_05720, partial [Anaerolineae bacterium]|nr:hypothetical protein [Anaerolineae bacterium]